MRKQGIGQEEGGRRDEYREKQRTGGTWSECSYPRLSRARVAAVSVEDLWFGYLEEFEDWNNRFARRLGT